MSEHTPGPWTIDAEEHDGIEIGPNVCFVYARDTFGPASFPDRMTAEDNARLIAAAPDLLAALENLWRDSVAYYDDQYLIPAKRLSRAREAIDKAKGVREEVTR